MAQLFDFVAAKDGRNACLCVCSDLFGPLTESVSVPLHVLLMIERHMLLYGAVLVDVTVKSAMGADAIPVKEHLNGGTGHTNIHFLLNVLVWHRVVHLVH